MGHAARTDANQKQIDQALKAMGWGAILPQLMRCDRLIIKAGRILLIEVKDGKKPPSARKLTPAEVRFQAWCRRYGIEVLLVESIDDLVQLDREARGRHER